MNRTAFIMVLMLAVILLLGLVLGKNARALLTMHQRLGKQEKRLQELEAQVKQLEKAVQKAEAEE